MLWLKRHLLNELHVPELSIVPPFVAPTDVCVDVGAQCGSWTVPLSRLVPKGKVIAFEAFPYYARVLQATVRLLMRRNVQVVNAAVLDKSTSAEVVWKDESGRRLTGFTHVAGTDENTTETLTVHGVTLDGYTQSLSERIAFVKIDVEGAECQVVRGAQSLVRRHRPLFCIEMSEVHYQRYSHTVADVFALLGGQGYVACVPIGYPRRVPGSLEWVGRNGTDNVWFVPSEKTDAARSVLEALTA
jgi:FkbM family methyltransferase